MTTKKNNPGKNTSRKGAPAAPKKPYATLDLKATELASKSGKSSKPTTATGAQKSSIGAQKSSIGAQKSSIGAQSSSIGAQSSSIGAQKSSGSGTKASDNPPPSKTTSTTSAKSPQGTGQGKTSGTDPSSASSTASRNSGAKSTRGPNVERKSGSRIKSTLSHLTAGALGGFLAFFAGDAIAPKLAQIGIPLPSSKVDAPDVTSDLQARITALEAASPAPGTANLEILEAQINATEAKLAQVDALLATIPALRERQDELAATLAKATAQIAPDGALGAVGERVTGLEEKLAALKSAAGNVNGASGSTLANLAAITGRLVDLETTLNNQMAALRKSVGQDIESRVSLVAQASEAAKSGTQRMDRQLATVMTDTARLSQRIETLKADTIRLAETMRVAREETGTLKSALDSFTGDTKKTISTLASHEDVANALTAVKDQIGALESNVSSVVRSETERKANAKRIVLSLELGNLKRALDRGGAYSAELDEVKSASAGSLDLSKLEAYEQTGVPTLATLKQAFRPVAHAILEAAREPSNGSFMDRFLSGARSIVKIRKVNHAPDDTSPEAIVGRIDKALSEGRLDEVIKVAKALPAKAMVPARDWLAKVEARRSVGVALGEIENKLKASLSGAQPASPVNPAPSSKPN